MSQRVTLEQLRLLTVVCEAGSFSAAGRQLGRAQSAVSQTIQALEDILDVQLFDRSARYPRLTPAGEVLLEQARQVLRQSGQLELTAKAIAGGQEPELGLAIDTMLPTQPVIRALAELQSHHPGLRLTLFSESLSGAEQRVRDGQALMGVCTVTPSVSQDLSAHELTRVSVVPVAAADHPLARMSSPVRREELAAHTQLILTNATGPALPERSIVGRNKWRFADGRSRLDFLLGGLGWGNVPRFLVEDDLANGRLKSLQVEELGVTPEPIPVYAVHLRERPLGPAARWLLACLQRQSWPHD